MDLQAFVQTTLAQLVTGIRAAQEDVKTTGARINPPVRGSSSTNDHVVIKMEGPERVEFVQFDVALTVESGRDTAVEGKVAGQAEGKLKVLGIDLGGAKGEGSAGGSKEWSQRDSTVSRVSFKIPVLFPRP